MKRQHYKTLLYYGAKTGAKFTIGQVYSPVADPIEADRTKPSLA